MNQHTSLEWWTSLLQLPGFQVVHVCQLTPTDPVRLTLLPNTPLGLCPHCHRATDAIHRRHESSPLYDLPLGPHRVELLIRTYQFQCSHCQRFFTPTAPVFAPGTHATERFLEQAARLIRISDIANVAAFYGVPEKDLERWYYDYVERQRQTPPAPSQPIRQLGIDELKLTHGSNQFVAVIVDHSNERVLEVLKSRTKEVVQDYLQQNLDRGVLTAVTEVTTDMWDGYVGAVREVFGARARITIDRFHVMKSFQEALTAARREIQRSLPKEEAQALKGTRWLWLTNQENLTAEQRAELAVLKARFPVLREVLEQRERFRALFEDTRIHTAAAGAQGLRKWLREVRELGVKALTGFCATVENWLEMIANYFVNRGSNGRTEGFNHGLRSILWRAFGMFNFEHFRMRVLDCFGRPKQCSPA
jgi:transposase